MGQPWVEPVEGGDYGGPSQDGPGPRCGYPGKVTLLPSFSLARWEITPFHIYPFIREVCKGSVNGKSTVVHDEVPNPCYNEYTCYNSLLLCLHRQKLRHPAV